MENFVNCGPCHSQQFEGIWCGLHLSEYKKKSLLVDLPESVKTM